MELEIHSTEVNVLSTCHIYVQFIAVKYQPIVQVGSANNF